MRRESKVAFPLSVCTCMVDVSAQARQTPARVKAKLVYCNTDELDTGMQKVQPLPFLGTITPLPRYDTLSVVPEQGEVLPPPGFKCLLPPL